MTPAVLAIPTGLLRLQSHLKYILCPLSTSTFKAFSSSIALDTEETPAMKALRDIPYPSASPDSSIFESWSNEYDRVRLPRAARSRRPIGQVPFSLSANKGRDPCDVLERLCRNGKFAEAEDIRQELVGMNIPIRPSSIYSRAAWNVLRQRPWPPNRTEMFANWLFLLPDHTQDNDTTRLGNLRSPLLFNSNQLDLGTVAQFGIILSSKGYIRTMGANVIACLTRYAHPDVSSRILDEMMAADDDCKRNKLGVSRQPKHTSKRLWSVAVRTHCTAGRPEVAFQMVKRAHELGIHITQYSYQYLLGKLEADGLKELAAEVRALPNCGSLDVAKRRLDIQEVSDPRPILPISHKQNRSVNSALALAILQRSSRSGLPAYATDLVPYFDLYKTDLRGEAVNWLRSRAYRLSYSALSTVLLAELLHHHRRGQFRHVLWVFEKFFHAVAVPSEDITRRLWKRHHYPPLMRLNHWSLPHSITKTTFNFPSRLWPSTHHTALVWSALVHLCESKDELFALYDQLLQHSTRFLKPADAHRLHRHHYHCHCSHDHSMTPTAAPADRHDAAHFQAFLIAFTHLRGAQYGLRVLDDMQDRGVAPDAHTLSVAAALQARHGEPALALRMLDTIRGTLEHGEDGEAKTQRHRQALTAYTGVLRGFADGRDLAHARRVAGMLAGQLGYVEGNARTDAVLRFVRRLEVEGPGAEPEPFAEADDDWRQQQPYLYPFLKQPDPEVGLPSLLFAVTYPVSPPWGEVVNRTFCDVVLRLKFTRGVDCCFTVQFIETLNAAPGTN
jgi:hypothetical protein